jgi:uncharacterized protein (DUF2235 family)
MKRLVFCFDGTWNKLDAQYPTNVVLTAESVLPLTKDKRRSLTRLSVTSEVSESGRETAVSS